VQTTADSKSDPTTNMDPDQESVPNTKCTPNLEYRSIRIELRDEQVTGYTDFRSDNISANRKKGNQALGAV